MFWQTYPTTDLIKARVHIANICRLFHYPSTISYMVEAIITRTNDYFKSCYQSKLPDSMLRFDRPNLQMRALDKRRNPITNIGRSEVSDTEHNYREKWTLHRFSFRSIKNRPSQARCLGDMNARASAKKKRSVGRWGARGARARLRCKLQLAAKNGFRSRATKGWNLIQSAFHPRAFFHHYFQGNARVQCAVYMCAEL